MKKLLVSLTILMLLSLSSFGTFAEKSENIKTSEFITTVMKETYGELPLNEAKPYLPYALKAIEEGIILPGEISDYNSDIEKKIAFQILDRIAEKEKKASKYTERLTTGTEETTPKYIGVVEFDNLLKEFLIKIGKKEKKGRYFTLEEINDKFETQEELEEFLDYQVYLDDEKKYDTFDPAVRESKEFEEKIRKRYEKMEEPKRILLDGIYHNPSRGGTAERNKTIYDIATILHYHEAVLYTDSPTKFNDYDVLVKRNEGFTRFVFTWNCLYNTNDEGYFSIMFYDEPEIDHILGNKFNVRFDVNFLADFRQEFANGTLDAESAKETEYMDDSIPMILREVLKVMYKDRVDELMEEIIKDYKQMMKNPYSTMTKTYMDTELREIVGQTFTVSVFGKDGGSIYKVYFEEE